MGLRELESGYPARRTRLWLEGNVPLALQLMEIL